MIISPNKNVFTKILLGLQDLTKVTNLKIGSTLLPYNELRLTSSTNFDTTSLGVVMNGVVLQNNLPFSQLAIDTLRKKF